LKRKVNPQRGGKPKQKQEAALEHLGISLNTHRAILVLALGTLLLKSLLFAPISIWPLAFVCLVPWLVMTGAAGQAPRVYFYSYLMALLFFLWNMRWLYYPTGLGYVAMSIYLAVYFPLMACPIRHAVRRHRLPLALVVPVVWTGCEMLRSVIISGFPWFYLAHSPYKVLTLIQISDLVGAYGVSFVIAAVNGAVADVIFAVIAARRASTPVPNLKQARFSVVFAAVLLVFTCVYGWVQLARDTVTEGPKIAVLQGDFINTVTGEGPPEGEKQRIYFEMLEAAAVAVEKPDLYLLPESPWYLYLFDQESRMLSNWAEGYSPYSNPSYLAFCEHARKHQAYVVTGCATRIDKPNDLLSTQWRYNSAAVIPPDGSEPGRYDKVHLVYFGEIVPFRSGRLRFLYFWLNKLMPFSGPDGTYEYSLFPGDGFHSFEMRAASLAGRSYRFGIPICYEDVMPYVSRRFTQGDNGAKRVNFLLNISNDGWFGRGIQQPQHLAICVFRAVENRVGIARAVNTGVSAFIQPTGEIHDVVTGDPQRRWGEGLVGYGIARVGVDTRYSLYTRYGDWFGVSCIVLWLVIYVDYLLTRARTRKQE